VFWAEQLDPEGLSQGDVIDGVVFANVHPLSPAQKTSIRGQSGWLAAPWTPDGDGFCSVVARARKAMGLVLTHSCDIDKRHRKARIFVAPVQELSRLPANEQQIVLAQERIALFPLVGSVRGDLYADLRSASAIDPRMIDEKARVQSMTDSGRKMLQARLVTLFTRIDLATL
jgi:hypothetical protein